MTVADFHNDILTSEGFKGLPLNYSEHKIVTAIFRGERSFDEAIALSRFSNLLAFEDIGYNDFDLEKLVGLKPLYVGLTWNGENRFGYGCDYSFGLKRSGVEIIKNLNRYKVAIDTAHISKKGFIDIVDSADKIVNSHTCFNGVYKHKRNLDDWQIKLLIEKGGLIGITCCGYFMSNRKTCKIADFIDNILYFYERYGAGGLCFGTDFFGTDFLPEGLENYDGFQAVSVALSERGICQKDVEKILFTNLNDFIEGS